MKHIGEAEQIRSFLDSRLRRPGWGVVPEPLRPRTADAGYRLQRQVHRQLSQAGNPRVGYKIGCTAPSSRAPFGLREPIYAGIFTDTRHDTLASALAMPLIEPSIECEIAVSLGADIDPIAEPADDVLLAAIASMHVACEVVDSRYGMPPARVGVPTLLVDDFLHAAFVLGSAVPASASTLLGPSARLHRDGEVRFAPVPDTLPPLHALRWLVGKLAHNGDRLRAGEIVLTGSILEPVPVVTRPTSLALHVDGAGTLTMEPGVTSQQTFRSQ